MSIRLGLLGVGSQCRNEHLPALRYLKEIRGGEFELAAVCDINRSAAEDVASELGFSQIYDDLDTLLAEARLDALIAVTPTSLTCELTCKILEAGVPVLMEKPLGVDMAEAHKIVEVAERTGTRVLVGMNRRLDPSMRQAYECIVDRDIRYARAVIHRQNRREKGFVEDAALHLIDVLCAVLGRGELEAYEPIGPDCGEAGIARIRFGSTLAQVEILPASAAWEETYVFAGNGFMVTAVPQKSVTLREGSQMQLNYTPPDGTGGRWTTGETDAFLDALLGKAAWTPTPREVLHSMKLTAQVALAAQRES